MASLFVVEGHDQGKYFDLQSLPCRIGRDVKNEIQLLDSETSRQHAQIEKEDGKWQLVDRGSSNGTMVNGQFVRRHVLQTGDRVVIGGTTMIFTSADAPAGNPNHGVDIVAPERDEDASRILSSLSQSGSVADLAAAKSVKGSPRPMPSSDSSVKQVLDADRSLEVIYKTALAVGRAVEIDEVLARVLRLVFDWVDADRGCIMLRDPKTGALRPASRCDRDDDEWNAKLAAAAKSAAKSGAVSNAESDAASNTGSKIAGSSDAVPFHADPALMKDRISISRTILDYVIDQGQGVRTSDAKDDSRFDATASIVTAGIREAICIPLQGRFGIVGAIYVDTYSSPGDLVARSGRQRFHDEHLRIMTAIGHQAALAIEDTMYYSALLQNERLAAIGQTIASLSHHIKNILQGMRGGGYLIEAGLKREDPKAIERGWNILQRNQDRVSNLVMDMLTFSKEREPELVLANWNETVADAAELWKVTAAEANINYQIELDDDLPPARFDPDAIHRAVLNLISNAIDAVRSDHHEDETGAAGTNSAEGSPATETSGRSGDAVAEKGSFYQTESPQKDAPITNADPNGFVGVKTCFDNGWIVEVSDNGPGIAAEDRERIFQLFESGKGMRGTGLGLPVCDKIMKEHAGEIQIDDYPGGGTTFRLKLPPEESSPETEMIEMED